VEDHSGSRVLHGRAILLQHLGQRWNHWNRLAAGASLGLVDHRLPDRAAYRKCVAGKIRPFHTAQLAFPPTTAPPAEKLDVTEKEVVEMERRLAAPEASLDAPIGASGDDDGTRTRLDYLPSEDERPDRAVAQSEFSQLLRGKLEAFSRTLEGREQTIFRERWLTDEPLTLQEIGDRYQVSRERARQLEKRMLDRLKKYLESELGTSVDIGELSRD